MAILLSEKTADTHLGCSLLRQGRAVRSRHDMKDVYRRQFERALEGSIGSAAHARSREARTAHLGISLRPCPAPCAYPDLRQRHDPTAYGALAGWLKCAGISQAAGGDSSGGVAPDENWANRARHAAKVGQGSNGRAVLGGSIGRGR